MPTPQRVLSGLLLAVLLASTGVGENWPQLGRTPEHISYVAEGPKMPFTMLWRRGFGERIAYAVQPIVAEGKVYVGTKSGSIFKVDAVSGDSKRLFKAGGAILATLAYADGLVYCASLDGLVYAVDADSGRVRWKYDTGFGISAAPLIAESKIFIVNRQGRAFSFNANSGEMVWQTDLGSPCLASSAYGNGKIFVGTEDMYFHALWAGDGSEVWKSEKVYGTSFLDGHPVVHKGRVVVHTLFREACRYADRVQPYDTMFGPWWWSAKDKEGEQRIDRIYERGGFGQELIAEQDKIIEFYRQNPEYKSTFVFDCDTGEQPYIVPNFRDGGNGLNPMPALASDGNLIMQFHLHGTGIGKFDIERGRFVDVLSRDYFGNNDEPHAFAVAGDILFAVHQEISHQQGSSFWNLAERKKYDDTWASRLGGADVYGWSPYQLRYRGYTSTGCLLKHGTSVSIAGNRFYCIRENWLDAFEGAKGEQK